MTELKRISEEEITLISYSRVMGRYKEVAQAQLKADQGVVEATLSAFEGKSPEHCSQHEVFVDECMACHNVCNENINWEMLDRMREMVKAIVQEIFEEIEKAECKTGSYHYCPNCDHSIRGLPDYKWQALKQKYVKEVKRDAG